jgi:hypothetical protein
MSLAELVIKRYHWALVVGSKEQVENGSASRFHAKEHTAGLNAPVWVFEERAIDSSASEMLLVRVMIAKVEKKDRLNFIVRKIPVKQGAAERNDIVWVQEVLRNLEADGRTLGTAVVEWTKVRNAMMDYCQQKKDGYRFGEQQNYDESRVPTYDLIEGKERIP